jgi:hypothetical protein
MAEQAFKEVDDEKRARGGKRTSEIKIAEVSTSKSENRTKKAPAAETPELAEAQNIFDDPVKHSDDYIKRSRVPFKIKNGLGKIGSYIRYSRLRGLTSHL